MNTSSKITMLVSLLLVAFVVPVQSQSDNFNDNNDNGWTHYAPLAPFGAPTTFILGNGAYGILPTASPDPALYGPALGGSFRNDFVYSDFSIRVDLVGWDGSLDQSFGIAARTANVGRQTTDAYTLTYDASGHLILSRLDNEVRTVLASMPVSLVVPPFIDPANSYTLTFVGTGNMLIGAVYDAENLAAPLAQVTAFDATYSTGVNGLIVFATDQHHGYATFDNYVAIVPEPSPGVLTAAGGMIVLCLTRLRRARGR